MKCIICISVQLNILCLICINRQYPQNCIEFDNDARVLLNFHLRYRKTRTISNTYGYSPDKIIRSKSKVSAERLLKGRKRFLQSVMVSVAVSILGKTDLVFVQSGAKINSVYYLPLRKLNSVLFSSIHWCVAVSALNRRVYRNCYTLLLGRLLLALAPAVIDR